MLPSPLAAVNYPVIGGIIFSEKVIVSEATCFWGGVLLSCVESKVEGL